MYSIPKVIFRHKVQKNLKPHPKIKNIIAVASGKGGVGKSTIAYNLAKTLAKLGAKTGLLDADIYGPSVPILMKEQNLKAEANNKQIIPVNKDGIQTMSIGYLVDQGSALVWRGPMVSSALQQLLNDTAWDNLDYLILDLPPGTGDIQLTMAQKIPISAAIIVTTPQDLALADANKAIAMFNKVGVNILGIVENMSYYTCPKCSHQDAIFGDSKQYELPVLAKFPLTKEIHNISNTQLLDDLLHKFTQDFAQALAAQPKAEAIPINKINITTNEANK